MAKKQKAKDKTDLKDESIDNDIVLDEEESPELDIDSSLEEANEIQTAEDQIKDLEEALLRSRAELDNAFKRNPESVC